MSDEQGAAYDDESDAFEAVAARNAPTETPGQQDNTEQASIESEQAEAETTVEAPREPVYAQITAEELEALKQGSAKAIALERELAEMRDKTFGKIGGVERQMKELADAKSVGITDETIAGLREDGWDTVADALESLKGVRVIGQQAQAIPEEMVERATAIAEQRVLHRVSSATLAREVPDWQQIDADPAWLEYVKADPARLAAITAASRDYDTATLATHMKAFKAQSAKPPTDAAQRSDRLRAAITPRGTGSTPEPDDDESSAFEAVARRQRLSRR